MSQAHEEFSANIEEALKASMGPIVELEMLKRKEYLNVEEVAIATQKIIMRTPTLFLLWLCAFFAPKFQQKNHGEYYGKI